MKRSALILAACGVLLAGPATAIVLGSSNFSLRTYPDANCYEPSIPYGNDQFAWDSFESRAREYVNCINEYVEAGDNDIRRIREAQEDARQEAEEFTARIRRR